LGSRNISQVLSEPPRGSQSPRQILSATLGGAESIYLGLFRPRTGSRSPMRMFRSVPARAGPTTRSLVGGITKIARSDLNTWMQHEWLEAPSRSPSATHQGRVWSRFEMRRLGISRPESQPT
jgi:hypothetical protein